MFPTRRASHVANQRTHRGITPPEFQISFHLTNIWTIVRCGEVLKLHPQFRKVPFSYKREYQLLKPEARLVLMRYGYYIGRRQLLKGAMKETYQDDGSDERRGVAQLELELEVA